MRRVSADKSKIVRGGRLEVESRRYIAGGSYLRTMSKQTAKPFTLEHLLKISQLAQVQQTYHQLTFLIRSLPFMVNIIVAAS